MASAAASSTMLQTSARNARSRGASMRSASTGSMLPSVRLIVPVTLVARRRISRAGVLRLRCAAEKAKAPAAASAEPTETVPVWAT